MKGPPHLQEVISIFYWILILRKEIEELNIIFL